MTWDWAEVERRAVMTTGIFENTLLMRGDLRETFPMRELQDLSFRDLCKLWCDFKNQEDGPL